MYVYFIIQSFTRDIVDELSDILAYFYVHAVQSQLDYTVLEHLISSYCVSNFVDLMYSRIPSYPTSYQISPPQGGF